MGKFSKQHKTQKLTTYLGMFALIFGHQDFVDLQGPGVGPKFHKVPLELWSPKENHGQKRQHSPNQKDKNVKIISHNIGMLKFYYWDVD